MDNLIFRATGRQLRNLAIFLVVLIAVGWVAGTGVGPQAGAAAVGLWIVALIDLCVLVAYSVARTECTPAGIRTRGLGRPRSCEWPDVRDISVRPGRSRIVVVTTATGRQFWLGARKDGGIMPDPDFWAKLAQIQGYWADRQPRLGSRPASDAAKAISELFAATSNSLLMQMHHPEPPPPVDEPDEPDADAGASPGAA